MRFETTRILPTLAHVAVCQAYGIHPAPALGILFDPLTGESRLLEVAL